jgi:hypothetical protein
MAKKLIVTEEQLRVITQHIDENDKALNELLSEGVIEEGFKEIALSILMLAGATLSGQNQAVAQDALNNTEIIKQVDNVLNNQTKFNSIVKMIDNKLPNSGKLIMKNAEKIKTTVNYLDAKTSKDAKVRTATAKTPQELSDKLRQGYAVSDVQITRDTILPEASTVIVQDTIDFQWSSDNFFVTAGFDLNEAAADSLGGVINDLKEEGGKILGVSIESSTDMEPIRMGNEKLAQLRANNVQEFVKGLDIDSAIVKIITKPNSGPNIYSKTMSSGERVQARIETAQYRYVKVKIIVAFSEVSEGETAPQVIEKHEVKLVKIINHTKSTSKHKPRSGKPKFKCVKINLKLGNGKTKTNACPRF